MRSPGDIAGHEPRKSLAPTGPRKRAGTTLSPRVWARPASDSKTMDPVGIQAGSNPILSFELNAGTGASDFRSAVARTSM